MYYDIAYKHSMQTIKEFIRKDFSTVHMIDFDLNTGKIIRKITVQGYSKESCWSRGQAWAIYGFTLAYKATKDKIFLKTAEKLADYFLKFCQKTTFLIGTLMIQRDQLKIVLLRQYQVPAYLPYLNLAHRKNLKKRP